MAPPPESPKTVVVIDDDDQARALAAVLLGRDPDLVVAGGAADAAGGLDLVAAEQPDLIVLDVVMPDRSGLEIMADLRAVSPRSKIVLWSALGGSGVLGAALAVGADGFVCKLDPAGTLRSTVRELLSAEAGDVTDAVDARDPRDARGVAPADTDGVVLPFRRRD